MRSDSQLLPTLLSTMMIWYFGVAACHGQANPDYQLSLSSGSGQQGTTVDLIVSFDNTGETVRAWAFGPRTPGWVAATWAAISARLSSGLRDG